MKEGNNLTKLEILDILKKEGRPLSVKKLYRESTSMLSYHAFSCVVSSMYTRGLLIREKSKHYNKNLYNINNTNIEQ